MPYNEAHIRTSEPRILIVEDHDTLRASLRDWLQAVFREAEILTAGSGEEALAAVAQCAPDIVLMDLGLPGIDGNETTRRIKAICPATEVIVSTMHGQESYQSEAVAAGASAFVPKHKMYTLLAPLLARTLVRLTR